MKLTKEELLKLREQVLKLKNAKDIEKLIPKESAYQLLVEANKDRLDRYAINYLGKKLTFRELFLQIDIVAKALYEKGIRPKDNVAVGLLSTTEAIVTFYALNKIGALAYMVNATHDKETLKEDIKDSKAKMLIINSIFYDKDMMEMVNETAISSVVTIKLDEVAPLDYVGDRIKFMLIEAIKSVKSAAKIDDKCISWHNFIDIGKHSNVNIKPYYIENLGVCVASTSGTSGKPKRPLITNENLNAMPIQMGMTCDAFSPNDTIFTTLPTWILYSLVNSIHEPLCLGVTVALDPLVDSKHISKRIKEYQFNHWNTIPAYIEDLTRDKKINGLDLSHLKTITTGGDYRTPKLKLTAEHILKKNNSNVEIGQGYGTSETCGSFCYTYEPGMPAKSVGKTLIGNKYKIVNLETNELCSMNETGELYLYSPTIMKEYYNNPVETSKAIKVDENNTRWYKTEDMAHYDKDGLLYIDGRIRRIEISKDSNGMATKVFPDVIKQIISLHPAILQCEILMVPDEERITRPVAYLVLKNTIENTSSLEKDIYKLCIDNKVASYIIPTEYEYVTELPRNGSLKVDFNELQRQYDMKHNGVRKRIKGV